MVTQLLLFCTIALGILSSWCLVTFIRLNGAKNTYPTPTGFENSCHVSTTYVKGGLAISAFMLVFSIVCIAIAVRLIY
jgi:hypothetical protein